MSGNAAGFNGDGDIKQPLLTSDLDQSQETPNGIYYDSFPRIGPTPETASPVNAAGGDKFGEDDGTKMAVYRRRWYILVVYGLFAFTQNAVWNTWGPISTTSEEAFGWDNSTIAWMSNWGPISYILTGLFFPWLLQVKGLRWATVSSMFCVTLGTALRIITSEPDTATILIHIGQFLNGVAGPVAMGAIPTLSATWFPPHERVTATAIGSSIGVLGGAVGFILGPLMVSGGPPNVNMSDILPHNTTPSTTASPHYITQNLRDIGYTPYTPEPHNVTEARIDKERNDIMRYMYVEFGWSGLLFLACLIYFPSKPPLPPSTSATVEREKYWSGLWSLRKKGYFQIVAMTYGISTGVLNCWSSVLNLNLQPVGVSEYTAGWIGFYSTISSCVVALLIGRFADWFTRYIKLYILFMYILGLAVFVIFALMLKHVLFSESEALLYVTIIAGSTMINAAVPMMFELACELAYPASEGAANGWLTYINNFWGLIFLGIFFVPNIGTMWMNWFAIGAIGVCIPLIAMLKSRFNRLEVDEGVHTEVYVEQEVDVSKEYAIQSS